MLQAADGGGGRQSKVSRVSSGDPRSKWAPLPKPKRPPMSRGVSRDQIRRFAHPEPKALHWSVPDSTDTYIAPLEKGVAPRKILGQKTPEKMPARRRHGIPSVDEFLKFKVPDIPPEKWAKMTKTQKKKRAEDFGKAYTEYVKKYASA